MVRIPVDINYFAGGFRPMLSIILGFEDPKIFLPIKAISKIQLDKIVGKKREINIGGGKVQTIKLDNMELRIGDYLKTKMDVQFPLRGEDEKQPSLLGVDFLEKIKANFCFNPSKKESYLELEEH